MPADRFIRVCPLHGLVTLEAAEGKFGGGLGHGFCSAATRTYVAVDAVRDMLDHAYHPQLGENPAHPVDMLDMWLDPCGVDGCILVRGHHGPHADHLR